MATAARSPITSQPERAPPAPHALMRREITVSWHCTGGRPMGHTMGVGPKTAESWAAQRRAAADPHAGRRLATNWRPI